VARAIVQLARRPRSEKVVGRSGMPLQLMHALARPLYERLIPRLIEREHFQERPAEPTSGNLWQPMAEGAQVSGGWTGQEGKRRRPTGVLVGTAALAALGLGWLGLSEAGSRG
jgi:hypothetical protein